MSVSTELKKFFCFIPMINREPYRKSWFRMIYELVQLTLYHRSLPTFYFSRHLFRKDRSNIKDFIPNKVLYGIAFKMNDQEAAKMLSNKLFFDLCYGPYLKALPRTIMFNHGDSFTLGKEQIKVDSRESFDALLNRVVSEESSEGVIFIKKTYDSHGGKNIFRVKQDELPMDERSMESLYQTVIKSAFIFQDKVKQHEEMNRINPYCINTIRIDTFINPDGHCEVCSAYLRLSLNQLHVDNTSSGGVSIGINLDTGELNEIGFTSITDGGGSTLKEHPITGVDFSGFTIPFFDEVKALVVRAAKMTPSLRLVGWDVAIGPDGPVLIEGNNHYNITANDRNYGGYRKNPVFRKALKELNL